ncbi:AraC family transcriptional regulator [Paenibacillus radicis (ex Xue et al. 2023)]|uniref:AraC family transcriptional regulator n=1 Tax=Paenibacillus radicis (ex Xue et al. 2023) TaxID=2972489 RepID=A0ABT1YFS6_9BACL|nr:AraC family transcriptional regulator [Paenibacillus radicis (ex Xue et al. 2023)]MCR8632050.1 AraC family transcriptional regulator [Paenibacillus radicis (ex Xue et al. 2023)]
MFYDDIRLDDELNFVKKVGTLTEHEMHLHDALEISIVLKNNVKYHLCDRDYHGKPGDVYVFRPFEPHYNLAEDSNKPVEWTMVLFAPSIARSIPEGHKLLTPFYAADKFSPLIPAHTTFAQAIQNASKLAIAEGEQQLPGWRAKQFLYFIDILVMIFRYYEAVQQDELSNSKTDQGIINVIQYMLSHFSEDIDTNEMIVMSNLRKTMFFKKFKGITSLSPNEFISRLRLQSAVYLLDHTTKSITDIAFECGFHSLSYFNKQFKLYRGISPRDQRNHLKIRREL